MPFWLIETGDPILKQLTEEFEQTFGDLEEKSHRVSDKAADALSLKKECPAEIARVAIQIGDDLLIDAEMACDLLLNEYNRLISLGFSIPPVLTYQMNFAVVEGRWIEFLYSKFNRELEENTREIVNFESAMKDAKIETVPVEQILNFMTLRQKIGGDFITPIMTKWIAEHTDSTPTEMILVFTAAIHRTTYDQVMDRLEIARKSALDIYDFLWKVLSSNKIESTAVENASDVVEEMRNELQKDLDNINLAGLSEVLIQAAPHHKAIVDSESKYVYRHTPLSRQGMVGPDLTSPTDFLERDVLLARRRHEPERSKLLKNSIAGVMRAILAQNNTDLEASLLIVKDIQKRFKLSSSVFDDTKKAIEESIQGKIGLERLDAIKDQVFQFLVKYIIEGASHTLKL